MQCDKCGRWQSEQHRQVGGPGVYYCCRCNGCGPDCPAEVQGGRVMSGTCEVCGAMEEDVALFKASRKMRDKLHDCMVTMRSIGRQRTKLTPNGYTVFADEIEQLLEEAKP